MVNEETVMNLNHVYIDHKKWQYKGVIIQE